MDGRRLAANDFTDTMSSSMPIFVVHVHVASRPRRPIHSLIQRHDSLRLNSVILSRRSLKPSFSDMLRSCIIPSPFPCNRLIAFPIVPVLLRNSSFHGIVGHRLCQQLAGELEDCCDLGAGFPLVGPQHAQTHAAFLIVRHVGVIDFRSEGDGGGLEGVFGG